MRKVRLLTAGFTLIEAIVTLAIVAIMVGMAMPSFATWLANQQIRAAAESVSNGLQLARATAMNANVPVRFWFHDVTTNQSGWTVCYWDLASEECLDDPNRFPNPIQRKSSLEGSPNVTVGVTTNAGTAAAFGTALTAGAGMPAANGVTFGGLGRPVGPPESNFLRLDLRNTGLSSADERRLVALVSPSGGARICDPKADPTKNPQGC